MYLTGFPLFLFCFAPLLEMKAISKVNWNESEHGITEGLTSGS